jgi:tRNA threonylcarbamoyladenosine biosynthesis protein TsaE
VALEGELGSGKTVFAKGICQGLGVRNLVTSPTFIIVNEYTGRIPVYHVDLYRVDTEEELQSTGFDDILSQDGVSIVEWAEKVKGRFPPPGLDVFISYLNETERELRMAARGEEAQEILSRLRDVL